MLRMFADLTAELIYHNIDADFTKPINISDNGKRHST